MSERVFVYDEDSHALRLVYSLALQGCTPIFGRGMRTFACISCTQGRSSVGRPSKKAPIRGLFCLYMGDKKDIFCF